MFLNEWSGYGNTVFRNHEFQTVKRCNCHSPHGIQSDLSIVSTQTEL